VTGVAPGEYDLVVRLYEQPVGCLVETVGEKVVPVKAYASGAINLGAIDVPCRAGPRPGTDMSAYRFTDVEGRERLVGDMSGRYVLMHVWASWCEPCLATMPEVEAAAQRFGADKAVFVGLNVDRDKPAAKSLAERRHWNWAQNYLGDDSDMVRQLAISSVPVYYLIGPDGLLVHAGADAAQALSKLTEALTPRVSMTP
jgi:thiol-disulfide isomerase/thioredoxin